LNEIKGGEDLVAQAIAQIGSRIDTLEAQNSSNASEELARYRQAYRVFAGRLFESVKSRQLNPEQSYPFRQALARSYEYGEKEQMAKAAAMFKELDAQRPNDFVNLRGLARCHRRLGEVEQAMSAYNRLVEGLSEDSRDWWRMQIERLAYYLEVHKGDPKAAGEVLLQIRTLRNLKGDKMLSWKQFAELELQAAAVAGGGAATTSSPATRNVPAIQPATRNQEPTTRGS
jgi:tetratricopeptide (TPR) repeat protein